MNFIQITTKPMPDKMKNNSIYQTFFKTYIDLDKVVSMDYFDNIETPKEKLILEDFRIVIKCQLLESPIILSDWIHNWINDKQWSEITDRLYRWEKKDAVLRYFKENYFDVMVSDWIKYKTKQDAK